MKRYFCKLAYDGTNYHGWQIQPNAPSVQQIIQEKLSLMLQADISVMGCGRTDTGVHATCFYLHFEAEVADAELLVFKMNNLLPHDIAFHSCFEVGEEDHARFSATARTYHYDIVSNKDPFSKNRAWLNRKPLDVAAMNEAAAILVEYTDFSCFSKSQTQTATNDCDVTEAYWTESENGLRFTISANRFLRNMVRAVVGTLVQVGEGRMNLEQFKAVIDSKDRSQAGTSVPAEGLYLVDVKYPFTDGE